MSSPSTNANADAQRRLQKYEREMSTLRTLRESGAFEDDELARYEAGITHPPGSQQPVQGKTDVYHWIGGKWIVNQKAKDPNHPTLLEFCHGCQFCNGHGPDVASPSRRNNASAPAQGSRRPNTTQPTTNPSSNAATNTYIQQQNQRQPPTEPAADRKPRLNAKAPSFEPGRGYTTHPPAQDQGLQSQRMPYQQRYRPGGYAERRQQLLRDEQSRGTRRTQPEWPPR